MAKFVSYADLSHPQCRKTTVCSTLDVNEDNFGESDKGGETPGRDAHYVEGLQGGEKGVHGCHTSEM